MIFSNLRKPQIVANLPFLLVGKTQASALEIRILECQLLKHQFALKAHIMLEELLGLLFSNQHLWLSYLLFYFPLLFFQL
jgi:hypothetical protein